jgi:hypothetical protein
MCKLGCKELNGPQLYVKHTYVLSSSIIIIIIIALMLIKLVY